jgi:hypothetical protein
MRYRDGNDDTSVVRNPYSQGHHACLHARRSAPAIPADPFFAQVIRNVRRTEIQVRREERLTGIPHRFSYCLRETSHLTGLPVPRLRRLIRAAEITANKTNGWWMLPRKQFRRLLSSRATPRNNAL